MFRNVFVVTIILVCIGLLPYKWPRNSNKTGNNELLVDHKESTCTASLYVIKGELKIPHQFQNYFQVKPTEFNLDPEGLSVFDPVNENQGNWFLISENQFVITGEITGVDSSFYRDCGTLYPIFKISNWSPTKYHANFWSFSTPMFTTYWITLFISCVSLLVLFFIRKPFRKEK